MIPALIITAAIVLTIAVPTLLIAATGGRTVLYTDRDLTRARSTHTRRAPKKEG